jgi:phage-related protein
LILRWDLCRRAGSGKYGFRKNLAKAHQKRYDSVGMIERPTPIPLVFWKSAAGNEPVREWLNELPREDQRIIGRDIARVQYGWPVGLPVCRPMGKGLWEVRSSLPSKREARVLFGFHEGTLIALTAFIKKRQATPAGELALAQQRWKEATA